jgi:hypothetical protein
VGAIPRREIAAFLLSGLIMKLSSTLIPSLVLGCLVSAASSDDREVRLQSTFEPAFRIEPLVQRFNAPRGRRLDFEFTVETVAKATSLRIRPVAMKQEDNGVIMPDEQAPPPNVMHLETPAAVELQPGEKTVIRGWLQVPSTDANFHAFGVLVKDLGSPAERQRPEGTPDSGSRVGIQFITQYLLRCDVSVSNGHSQYVRQLQLEQAELLEHNGRPLARVWITNPTDGAVEFSLRAVLSNPRYYARGRKFPLVLPIRANLDGPERNVARILAHSRVRMEEILEDTVFPGDHELFVELLDGHRVASKATFPIAIHAGDFPAQDVEIVQAGQGVSLEPGQLELSLGRGGKRFLALTADNSGQAPARVRLIPETLDGQPCEWFAVRPAEFQLEPGRRRTVLVTIGPQRDDTRHRYAALRAFVDPSDAAAAPRRLLVSILGSADDLPQIEAGDLQWQPGEPPAFTVPVRNPGKIHAPLTGTLTLTEPRGRSITLSAGFGRWLLPGQTEDLRFPLKQPLPPGLWELRTEISVDPTLEPIRLRQVIQTGPAADIPSGGTVAPESAAAVTIED